MDTAGGTGYWYKEKIEEGGTGEIFEVIHLPSQQSYVAKVPRQEVEEASHSFEIECEMLLKFNGTPHIIPLIDIVSLEGLKQIILPKMKGTLLDQVLDLPTQKFPEKQAAGIFKQICIGLKQLHDSDFAHLDIKPENILQGFDNLYYICDLGSLCETYTGGKEVITTSYAAPEIKMRIHSEYPLPADIWSLGILLCDLIAEHPENIICDDSVEHFIDTISNTVSAVALDLLVGMLKADCYERLTVDEILEHPWIANVVY